MRYVDGFVLSVLKKNLRAYIQMMCGDKATPFDIKRMAYGGFTVIVDAG